MGGGGGGGGGGGAGLSPEIQISPIANCQISSWR